MEGFHINSTSQNQSCNHCNNTTKHDKVVYVLTCIIIAIGLPLTLMAIYSLYCMVRNHHIAPIYIINILISDLIQHCCMIVEVAKYDDVEKINISYHIYFFALCASVYFMVCISLERYLVIAHIVWYRFRRTIKTSVAVCVVVWVFSLVYIIPHFFHHLMIINILLAVFLLPPFPLFIFFLVGTLRALSAAISVPSDEKRRIVGILVLVLLIYTLLYLPGIILFLKETEFKNAPSNRYFLFAKLSPLADLVLYFFMRKGVIDKLLVSVCCCRMDSNDISSPSLYISTKSSTPLPPVPLINCLKDIKNWMDSNLLKLNKDKTELVVFAPQSLLKKVGDITLDVDGCSISASPQVRNLGLIMDSTLSFQQHIKNTTKTAFYHLKNISRLQQWLSNSVAETHIHSFITS
ncbi:G-protein coupled receptor 4-like [Micropterus dolomieu]|uniref:G-protein coupled receptor 4-like n=1 Tax=Micropterus dolomieu TaxID=147949 RepID=UPI001E8E866A|nr:G-protein coupled receptor 4-like [Micropterus dolomieu]